LDVANPNKIVVIAHIALNPATSTAVKSRMLMTPPVVSACVFLRPGNTGVVVLRTS